jgi:hypothetical protein
MQNVLEQLILAQFDARLEGGTVRVALPRGRSVVVSEHSGAYTVMDGEGERTSIVCGTPEEVVDAVKAARG